MDNPAYNKEEDEVIGTFVEENGTNSVVIVVEGEKQNGNKQLPVNSTNAISVISFPPKIDGTRNVLSQNFTDLNMSSINDLLGTTLGFYMEANTIDIPSCPQMTIFPLVQSTTETNETNKESASSQALIQVIRVESQKLFNWLLCCFSSTNAQMVHLTKRNEPVLSFKYDPFIWCPATNKDRFLNIFLPGVDERFGWIEAARDVGQGSELHCFTGEKFVTRQVEEKGSPKSFKIENGAGIEVANGRVTTSASLNGLGLKRWMGYQFNFVSSEIDTLPLAVRAVMLVAFIMWVIDAREKRQWTWIWSFLFVAFLLVSFLLIQFYGPDSA